MLASIRCQILDQSARVIRMQKVEERCGVDGETVRFSAAYCRKDAHFSFVEKPLLYESRREPLVEVHANVTEPHGPPSSGVWSQARPRQHEVACWYSHPLAQAQPHLRSSDKLSDKHVGRITPTARDCQGVRLAHVPCPDWGA
jgi:hypothetical protein